MSSLKTLLTGVAWALLLVASWLPEPTNTIETKRMPSLAPPWHPALVDLVPESAVAVIELRDVTSRWAEIRAVPAVRRFQERLLETINLRPEDLPRLLGDRAVLALVPSRDGRGLLPLALLRPPRPEEAAAVLEAVTTATGRVLRVVRRDGVLWVGPAGSSDRLEELAGSPSSFARRGDAALAELDRRLPEGGLVRGRIEARPLAALLRHRPEGTRPYPVELIRSMLAVELDAVRVAGFRRDLVGQEVVTDAVVAYDTGVLPIAVARVLGDPRGEATLPPELPPGVLAMVSFRPEPEAALAWLRHVSASDPRGPLRMLDFWLDEFAERFGRDLERDLVETLGDRGWLCVLAGEGSDRLDFVAIVETYDAPRLEGALLDLRAWLAELARGRSLGLAVPEAREETTEAGTVHGIALRTPLGDVDGPSFLAEGRHLLVGSGDRALRAGLRLLDARGQWRATAADASALVSGPALSSLTSAILVSGSRNERGPLEIAVAELVSGLDTVSLDVRYRGDGLGLRGRLRFASEERSAAGYP